MSNAHRGQGYVRQRLHHRAGGIDEKRPANRGSVIFSSNGIRIRLGATMDKSTLLHEFGHLFLRDLEMFASRMEETSIRDMKILKAWWGTEFTDLAAPNYR